MPEKRNKRKNNKQNWTLTDTAEQFNTPNKLPNKK